MTYYGRWTYKYEEGARRGAAGVLVIHEIRARLLRLGDGQELQHEHHVRHRPPEPRVRAHAVRRLDPARPRRRSCSRRAGLTSKQAKAGRQEAQGLPSGRAQVDAQHDVNAKTEVITSYNVVGILPGKTRPDETVIYTAHHDHLGIGLPDANGDRIYNGALDNATGTAHLIEQARAFAKKPRTDRSVVFLAVAAEEKGLLGSEYLCVEPALPARQDRRRSQHGRRRDLRPCAGLQHLGTGEARTARHADCGRPPPEPHVHARSARRGGQLLPFGPLPIRQDWRSGDLLASGHRPASGRTRPGARRCRTNIRPSATTSRTTNMIRTGT